MAGDRPSELADPVLRARIKDELRRQRLRVRRATPADARARRSREICDRVLAMPEWSAASTIAVFYSMSTEVQTEELITAAHREGKRVVAPRVQVEPEDHLTLHAVPEGTQLEESNMGLREPSADAPVVEPAELSLILVPALAIDARGYRIGYGRGFYDRLLTETTEAFSLALVFDFELLAELPEHDHDRPVHAVATDRQVLRFVSGR